MNNILNILLALAVAIIVVLQIFGVGVSQKAINITYGIVLLLFIVGNSGWLHL